MKRVYLSLLLLVTLVACTNNDAKIDKTEAAVDGKIYATIDNGGSRVHLNSDVQTVWNEGDEITILGPTSYAQYRFDGKTGDRSGTFSNVESFAPILDKATQFNALYPGHGNLNYSETRAVKDEMIATLLPVQKYTKDSYYPKSNIMIGSSPDGSSYVFKNVVSYLRLSLVGQKAIKSIQLKGNNSEFLAGQLFINTSTLKTHLKGDDSGNSKNVILDCGDGVQLSETPIDFYFTLPAMTLSKGFSLVIEFTDGTLFSRTRAKQFSLNRNTVYPMAVLNVDPSDKDMYVYIDHAGTHITTPQIFAIQDIPASGSVIWGDGTVALLEGQSDDYIYSDGKPTHKVTIQTSDANIITLKHCKGISRIDFSNF